MKNADQMLRAIIGLVDTSGDGKIQYEGGFWKNGREERLLDGTGLKQLVATEFRVFVEAAERQLLLLFRSIDRDKDGRLNKEELRAAFRRAGLAVPMRRLSGFFDKIDQDNDGYITFEEWRYVLFCFVVAWPTFNVTGECAGPVTTGHVTLSFFGRGLFFGQTMAMTMLTSRPK